MGYIAKPCLRTKKKKKQSMDFPDVYKHIAVRAMSPSKSGTCDMYVTCIMYIIF